MKIFGHPWIESEEFYVITHTEEITETPPNSTVAIERFDITLIEYCNRNSIPYMTAVSDIKEAIFANLLHAKYMVASKALAKRLMPIAQNYLFDTEVLGVITSEEEIEEMAKANIDGVLLTLK